MPRTSDEQLCGECVTFCGRRTGDVNVLYNKQMKAQAVREVFGREDGGSKKQDYSRPPFV